MLKRSIPSRYTALFVVLQLYISCVGASKGNGTTDKIKEIFLGRCYDYLEFRYHPGPQGKNCTDLYHLFEEEFYNKTNCSDDFSRMFTQFFQAVDPGLTEKDKALFWSGTTAVAHGISNINRDYVTLEDTFPGYIANNLNFCGEGTIGFNYAQCICKWQSSEKRVFWRKASTQFARNAQGIINVLVNGTRNDNNPAYRNNSIFTEVELPNLNATAITLVKILVAMDIDKKPRESCGKKSIKKLQDDIKARQIKVKCIDEPSIVYAILCAMYQNEDSCKILKENHSRKGSRIWFAVAFACMGICVILSIIISWHVHRLRRMRLVVERI